MSAESAGRTLSFSLVRGARAVAAELARADPHRLLTVSYGLGVGISPVLPAPTLEVPNRVPGDGAVAEIWRADRPVSSGRHGVVDWSEAGDWLGGCVTRPLPDESGLAGATREHFGEVLDLLEARGGLRLARVWNYLPGINRGAGDRERYRLFNQGRARAFEERFGAEGADWLAPASSAVGAPGDALRTAFLACRAPLVHLENPRQIPAHRYPREYGPRAPSFSRATLATSGRGLALFLAGTASVVGSETLHAGALSAQIRETLCNVEHVLAEARRVSASRLPPLAGFDLVKVYLREEAAAPEALEALAGALAPETPVVPLVAEICRSDLLVELDGVALGA